MNGSQPPVAALCHHAGPAASQGPTTFGSLQVSPPLLPPELPPMPPMPACPPVADVVLVLVAPVTPPVPMVVVAELPTVKVLLLIDVLLVVVAAPPAPVVVPPVWLASMPPSWSGPAVPNDAAPQ